ncbi:hypothetical protein GBA52_003454 [Prunus armeniaca]|nr:hypothetical protein GBA52_003454 [Prunus armeniaca]
MDVIVESTLKMHALFKANVERLRNSVASLYVKWIKPPTQTLILNCDGAVSRYRSGLDSKEALSMLKVGLE